MISMEYRKEVVAMLLAGGSGSRLMPLTEYTAKPDVSFGGKYKIIDYTLTNCVHSGIDTVGVLTQYMPMYLHDYIGKGHPWNLDRMNGGVFLLPPYSSGARSDWYTGSANSVYQNTFFIDSYKPKYVLVLGGDHVYKMDYSLMIESHKKRGADCTIAVIEVPIEEASRYGIINTDKNDKIVKFEEKPPKPESNLASMGIYVFNWDSLKEYLELDNQNKNSSKDFGKDLLPAMHAAKLKMYAYRFKGYWKDVGTLESLWEANMDMIQDSTLGAPDWVVMSRSHSRPPHHISPGGSVKNSIISSGCAISGVVQNSVLSRGVVVEESVVIRDSVIMADCVIRKGSVVEYAILDERCDIPENSLIGKPRDAGAPITAVRGSWK